MHNPSWHFSNAPSSPIPEPLIHTLALFLRNPIRKRTSAIRTYVTLSLSKCSLIWLKPRSSTAGKAISLSTKPNCKQNPEPLAIELYQPHPILSQFPFSYGEGVRGWGLPSPALFLKKPNKKKNKCHPHLCHTELVEVLSSLALKAIPLFTIAQ